MYSSHGVEVATVAVPSDGCLHPTDLMMAQSFALKTEGCVGGAQKVSLARAAFDKHECQWDDAFAAVDVNSNLPGVRWLGRRPAALSEVSFSHGCALCWNYVCSPRFISDRSSHELDGTKLQICCLQLV